MARKSSAGIVFKDDNVLLIHRINKGDEYYTFPGGGQEMGESSEETAIREVKEETSVDVGISKLLYVINWDDGERNSFYLCKYTYGEPRLPNSSEEFEQMKSGEQIYEPMWYPVKDVQKIRLYPMEIRNILLGELSAGFKNEVAELNLIKSKKIT